MELIPAITYNLLYLLLLPLQRGAFTDVSVKHSLWMGTADIKDLYVEVDKERKPFLALIVHLILILTVLVSALITFGNSRKQEKMTYRQSLTLPASRRR